MHSDYCRCLMQLRAMLGYFFEGDGWGLRQAVTQTKKRQRDFSVVSCILMHQKVEAAGVEPASKLGTQKLSTRLFCD